jgi:hypothetical protein
MLEKGVDAMHVILSKPPRLAILPKLELTMIGRRRVLCTVYAVVELTVNTPMGECRAEERGIESADCSELPR